MNPQVIYYPNWRKKICKKKNSWFQCNHMFHPITPYLNPSSQSLLPSSLKPHVYTSPNKPRIHSHIKRFDISCKFIARIDPKLYRLEIHLGDYSLIIYISLYMNALKARVFLFHFTPLYIYYTFYTFILDQINDWSVCD